MRKIIRLFNLRKLSEESGVSYDVLKDYSSGRTKNLKKDYEEKIKVAIKKISKGV